MKNNYFGYLSVRLLALKQSASFWKLAQIGQKEGIKNISAVRLKIQYLYLDNILFFYFPAEIWQRKFEFKSTFHFNLKSGSLTLLTKKC